MWIRYQYMLTPAVSCQSRFSRACRHRHIPPRQSLQHQALFWFCVELISAVLMLAYTSIYRVVYHIPILNKFRGPSRHSFEWTLALSILAAYGWDALPVARARLAVARRPLLVAALAAGCAVLSVVSAGFWWRSVIRHLP